MNDEQQKLNQIKENAKFIRDNVRRLVLWEFVDNSKQKQVIDIESKAKEILKLLKGFDDGNY